MYGEGYHENPVGREMISVIKRWAVFIRRRGDGSAVRNMTQDCIASRAHTDRKRALPISYIY